MASKSYVETQIERSQRTIADAVAGKGLAKAIQQLQEKSRIKDSLKTLPARGSLTSKRKIAKRGTAGTGLGDFTETARTFHTNQRELRSSDGLLVLQFKNVATIVTAEGSTFRYLDYDPATMP
jgi:hypothetical protein